jgi:capsular exopolysaccharide synthesis family protein
MIVPTKSDQYLANSYDAERMPRYIPAPQAEVEIPKTSLPITHYFWVISRNRWKILGFVIFCMVATFLVCERVQPIYEGTARIDVDRRAPSGIIGQDSQQMAPGNDADQFLTTQIEFIQSDAVLRPVVQKFNLLEKEKQFGTDPEKARFLANAPVKLKNLKVVRPPNSFILRISYRSTDRDLASDVSNAIARSYIEQTYDIRVKSTIGLSAFMERQIEELRAKMENSSQALAVYERELNVINPEEKTNILSARLLQLNTEYTAAQSDRVHKEAAYNSMKTGSLAAVQVSSQADALAKLQERVQESKERLAELKATYGPNYSEYRRAASQLAELERQYNDTRADITQRIEVDYRQALNREEMLKQSVAETKGEYDKLNLRSFEYQQLKREADADKTLYEELVRKIKEAGINAGFQNSAIRIADLARPAAKPVFPEKGLMLFMSFLLSSILSVAAAIIADLLDNTIKDPEQAQRMLQVDVIGTLPYVKKTEMLSVSATHTFVNGEKGLVPVNGHSTPNSYKTLASYDEAIRTLRNSILLTDFDRRMNSLLITSSSPGEGKSTTAAHLAIAHAEQGKKTLLIDADLRRPSQHKRFHVSNTVGLSTALTGVLTWRDSLIKMNSRPNLDLIPAGPSSRRASDVIGPMMVELLEDASKEYDLIIVDAPPLLGFAEPLQLATAVDGVVVVTRAGETSRKAVATVLGTLDRLRVNVVGLVLNQVKKEMSDSYYYYGYYRKYYSETPAVAK